MRVGVVGARRVRQGTGEYLARDLARAGCEVCALVGTREASRAEAQRGLRERHGIEARAYATLPELLEAERPDAIVIASPPATHRELLFQAARAGCHVLAEKPLWWSDALLERPAAELGAEVDELTELFAARGRLLHLNAQWPYTLPGFRALYPQWEGGPPRELRMWLAPNSSGTTMVADSAPHLPSMLHHLAGPGELSEVEIELTSPAGSEAEALSLLGRYRHAQGTCAWRFDLKRHDEVPRPAGFAIDGLEVHRRVEMPSYQLSFATPQGDQVPLPDPLTASVEAFVCQARAGGGFQRQVIREGMTQLHELVSALARRLSPAGSEASAPNQPQQGREEGP